MGVDFKLGLKQFIDQTSYEIRMEQIDQDTVEVAREMALANGVDFPWRIKDPEILFKKLGLIKFNESRQKGGLTIAALLLFGKDGTDIKDEYGNQILNLFPNYGADVILRFSESKKYDKRVLIRSNLIKSYFELTNFLKNYLNDPFFLEGLLRVSIRDQILREIISNFLVYRNYESPLMAKIIVDQKQILIMNPDFPEDRRTNLSSLNVPLVENSTICNIFRDLKLFDGLGEGIQSVYKYKELYLSSNPTLCSSKNGFFVTSVPLIRDATRRAEVIIKQEKRLNFEDVVNMILSAVKSNSKITRLELAELIGLKSARSVQRYLNKIKNLKFVGHGKYGH